MGCDGSLSAEIEATQLIVSMEEFNKLLKEYQQIFPESVKRHLKNRIAKTRKTIYNRSVTTILGYMYLSLLSRKRTGGLYLMLTTMEEKKEYVQKFNVFDDTFFEMVAKDKDAVEDILRIILHDPELVVAQLIPQDSIKNLYGKSVRLDALCVTGDGRTINVEIQKSDNDSHAKRVRYNASCITANVSEPGENYENINDVYIVYISEFDVFHRKKRLYYVERSFSDNGEIISVDDGEHFIYVNASNDVKAEAEDTDVAELMAFFKNSKGQNDKFHRLTSRVYDLKNNESEVNAMCKLVEDYANEKLKRMICSLVCNGALSAEIGAEQLNVSMEEFHKLLKEYEQKISEPA